MANAQTAKEAVIERIAKAKNMEKDSVFLTTEGQAIIEQFCAMMEPVGQKPSVKGKDENTTPGK